MSSSGYIRFTAVAHDIVFTFSRLASSLTCGTRIAKRNARVTNMHRVSSAKMRRKSSSRSLFQSIIAVCTYWYAQVILSSLWISKMAYPSFSFSFSFPFIKYCALQKYFKVQRQGNIYSSSSRRRKIVRMLSVVY
jgi:hypothetical protein